MSQNNTNEQFYVIGFLGGMFPFSLKTFMYQATMVLKLFYKK